MKKIIALILVLTLTITSFAGCIPKEEPNPNFVEKTEDILKKINENAGLQMMVGISKLEKYLEGETISSFTGLTEDEFAKYVEEGYVSQPLTNTRAHSIVLLKLKNETYGKVVVEIMNEKIDRNKWGTASAEKSYVNTSGNYVFFVMSDRKTCDSTSKAFEKLFVTFGTEIIEESVTNTELFGKTEEIVKKINEEAEIQIKVDVRKFEIKPEGNLIEALTGLTTDEFTRYVEEGSVSQPFTNDQAFLLIVLKLDEASDSRMVAEIMNKKIDRNKWSTPKAEKSYVNTSGSYVFFVMSSAKICDRASKAFEELAGTFGTAIVVGGAPNVQADGLTAKILAEINKKVPIEVMVMDGNVFDNGLPTYGFTDGKIGLTEEEFKKLVVEGDYTQNMICSSYHHIIVLKFVYNEDAVKYKESIAKKIKEFPYVCERPESYYVNDSGNILFIAVTFAEYVEGYGRAFEEVMIKYGRSISGNIQ